MCLLFGGLVVFACVLYVNRHFLVAARGHDAARGRPKGYDAHHGPMMCHDWTWMSSGGGKKCIFVRTGCCA